MAVFERERINLTKVFNAIELELDKLGIDSEIDETEKIYLLSGYNGLLFLSIHMSSKKLTYFKHYLPSENYIYDPIYISIERIFYENC